MAARKRQRAKDQPSDESPSSATPEQIARWYDDPVLFSIEAFGITPWEAFEGSPRSSQADVLRAVAERHRVSCRSGHKTGKTAAAAILAWFWFVTRANSGTVITAPTDRQVKRLVWKELRALRRRATITLPTVPKDPGTGVQDDAGGRYIVGFSTDQPENMAGFSGPAMLFIVDEASGVDESIFEAIEGNTAGGEADDPNAVAKVVMFSNPTQTSGTFYKSFHGSRSEWSTHHISSEDTPNARDTTGAAKVPGLATRHYIETKRKSWGSGSFLYAVRVAGNFAKQGSDAVVPLGLVEAGIANWHADGFDDNECRLEIGVDVARFGQDDTVAAPRRGNHVGELKRVNGFDTLDVAGMVLDMARELHRKGERKPLIKMDPGGNPGPIDVLRRSSEVDIIEVNFGSVSDQPDLYVNKRSQILFGVRDYLEGGGTIPDDDQLSTELVAPKYGYDAKTRKVVESKKELRKRLPGGKSPDSADALALAIYSPAGASRRAKAIPPKRPRWGRTNSRGFG